MTTIKTALLSVSDKTGLVDLARALHSRGVTLLSTGGTHKALSEAGLQPVSISDYTGQPEILDGRVKTLHPKIFAGILARRDDAQHMETLADQGILPIDLVVVNLYPFEKTAAQPGVSLSEAIEQIDIGGVSLLRAAAKNHDAVAVMSDSKQFARVEELFGDHAASVRQSLAVEALSETSRYDAMISSYLGKLAGAKTDAREDSTFPATYDARFEKVMDLRYGENPHQKAAFYRNTGGRETSVAGAKQIHGKELSYNNILDLDAALEVVRVFDEPTCCIVKHNNPCGVARGATLAEAYRAARDCDPTSAFGGIVGLNREVDGETARDMADLFLEAIIAPSYSDEAASLLREKKNLRLMETGTFTPAEAQPMLRSVVGGLLVQGRDLGSVAAENIRVVSHLKPTDDDLAGLLFAWRVAKFVKSNSIVFATANATVGIGAGQMSRIDSTNIAAVKARSPIRGAYMASDAFFPFRDNVDRAADMGIRAIIQPGGSVRDSEVIQAADEHGMILVFTGMRHFRH